MFISLSHLQPHSCYWGQPKKRELFWGLGGDCAKKNSPGLLFFFSSALLSPLIYFPVALGCSKNRAVQNTIVPSGTVQSIRLGILYYNKVKPRRSDFNTNKNLHYKTSDPSRTKEETQRSKKRP